MHSLEKKLCGKGLISKKCVFCKILVTQSTILLFHTECTSDPGDPGENGSRTPVSLPAQCGMIVRYDCDEEFEINEPGLTRTCIQGVWEGPIPMCYPISK